MKYLFFLIFFSTQVHALDFLLEKDIGEFKDTKARSFDENMILEAKDIALEVLERAFIQNSWEKGFIYDNSLFKKMAFRLKNVTFLYEQLDKRLPYCDEKTIAFSVGSIGKEIVMCRAAIGWPMSVLVQVIIHETAHLVLGGDECRASAVEVISMMNSDFSYAMKNGYWDQCKTQDFFDRVKRNYERRGVIN